MDARIVGWGPTPFGVLAEKDRSARVGTEEVTARGGRLPVVVSGVLMTKAHPVGASGVSVQVPGPRQWAGRADAMQVPEATLAPVFNMDGAGVANSCSIPEASA